MIGSENRREAGLYQLITFLGTGLGMIAGAGQVLMCIPELPLSFGFRMVHEIGDGLVFLAYYHGIAKIFHVDKIGGCAAFISLWTATGGLSSSIVFGHMGDVVGHKWPLIISGIILIFIPCLLIGSRRTVMHEE